MPTPRLLTFRSPISGISSRRFWTLAFFAVFLIQILARYGVLTIPPYEDQAAGVWVEAEFLADSDFDYYRLRYEEKNYMDGGGVRSYMISVIPTLLALLFHSGLTAHAAIVVAHLFVFACAAWIVVAVLIMLSDTLPFPAACLVAAAMWTTPALLGQIDQVGMDVAMIAAGLVSTLLVLRQRFVLAGVASTLAFFVKGSASLFTLATIAYLLLLLVIGWTDTSPAFRRRCGWGLIANVVAFVVQRLCAIWADDPVLSLQGMIGPEMLALPRMLLWCWDLTVLLVVTAAITVALMGAALVRIRATQPPGVGHWASLRSTAWQWIREQPIAVYGWILVGGLCLSIHLFVFFPRYFAPGIVCLYLIMGELIHRMGRLRRLAYWSLVVVVIFNLVNRDGKLYFSSTRLGEDEFAIWTMWHPRMCVLTERSLEYIEPFDGELRALRFLATEYWDHPLFLEKLYEHYLVRPRLGIVDFPLPHVCSVEDFGASVDSFMKYMSPVIEGTSTNAPIFLWSGKSRTRIPPPTAKHCEILFADDGVEPLLVYRLRPETLPRTREELLEWYLDQTWDTSWIAMRALERSGYLESHGRRERAIRELRLAVEIGPSDHGILTPLVRSRLAELEKSESHSPEPSSSTNP